MQLFPVERRVRFVTVTCSTGTDSAARAIEERTGGAVESMEGAAVAHVAHLHGIPVGEVRGISNIVTDRDTSSWRLKEAAVGGPGSSPDMDRTPLNFAFSPCPNDTFAFHALVHGLVPGPQVVPYIDDVEALNARAERGEAEVTKISIAAYATHARSVRSLARRRRRGLRRGAHRRGPHSAHRGRPHCDSRRAHDGGAAVAPARPVRNRADAFRQDRGRGAARGGRLRRAHSRGPVHVPVEGPDFAGGSRRRVGGADAVPVAAGRDRDSPRPRISRSGRSTALSARASNTRSRIPTPAAITSPRTRRKWTLRSSPSTSVCT